MRNQDLMSIMFSKKTYVMSSLLFVGLYIIYDKYKIQILPLTWILALLAVITIISLVHSLEYRNQNVGGKMKKLLGYVGMHTLDIYVLHYFFVPRNMEYLKEIIAPNNLTDSNIMLELIICSCIACCIIFVTLCCSFLINENTILRRLVLGKVK